MVSSIIRSIPMMSVSPGGCRPPGPPAALRWLDDGVALGLGVGPLMDGCLSPDPAGVRSVGRLVGRSVGRLVGRYHSLTTARYRSLPSLPLGTKTSLTLGKGQLPR